MALDFPANPTNGQVYDSYVYNSAVGAWQAREDSRTVAILSSTVPASANPGDIWVNTNDGISFVYYDDGTSAQWMELLPSGVPLLNTKANLSGGNTFSDGQLIASSAVAQVPLTIKGFSGQTGNLQEWENDSGSVVAAVTPSGALTGYGPNLMQSFVTTRIPLTVKGSSGQTADLQQWQNSGGTVLSEVDSAGIITAPRFISTQATGTAPLTVSSTTAVTNLNADLLDGQHGSVYSPAGMVSQFAGATAPTGWLLCDGTAVSRTIYAALFTAIGTTYGAGDGSTTFNVPNLQGRVPAGKAGSGTFATLGGTGGAETHTLTVAQLPSITGDVRFHGGENGSNVWQPSGVFSTSDVRSGQYRAAGGIVNDASSVGPLLRFNNGGQGQAHNNLQPYIIMNYIIKV